MAYKHKNFKTFDDYFNKGFNYGGKSVTSFYGAGFAPKSNFDSLKPDEDLTDAMGKRLAREQEAPFVRSNLEFKNNRSVLDRVFSPLLVANYMSAGVARGLVNDDFTAFEGLKEGFKAGNPFGKGNEKGQHNFSKFLEDTGWKPENTFGKILKGTSGFVLDVLLDPTTYVSGGLTAVVKGSGRTKKVMDGLNVIGQALPQQVYESTLAKYVGTDVSASLAERFARKKADDMAKSISGGITHMTDDMAKTIVDHRHMARNIELAPALRVPLTPEQRILDAKHFSSEYNKLVGLRDVGAIKPIEFGMKNLPFGELYAHKFGVLGKTVKLGDGETLRKFSDTIGLSYLYSNLRKNIYGRKLGQLFSNKSPLYKAAHEKPSEFYDLLKANDVMRGIDKKKFDADNMIFDKFKEIGILDKAKQKEILTLLEDKTIFAKVKSVLNFSDTQQGKHIADAIQVKKVQLQKEMDDLITKETNLDLMRHTAKNDLLSARDDLASNKDMLGDMESAYRARLADIDLTQTRDKEQLDSIVNNIKTEIKLMDEEIIALQRNNGINPDDIIRQLDESASELPARDQHFKQLTALKKQRQSLIDANTASFTDVKTPLKEVNLQTKLQKSYDKLGKRLNEEVQSTEVKVLEREIAQNKKVISDLERQLEIQTDGRRRRPLTRKLNLAKQKDAISASEISSAKLKNKNEINDLRQKRFDVQKQMDKNVESTGKQVHQNKHIPGAEKIETIYDVQKRAIDDEINAIRESVPKLTSSNKLLEDLSQYVFGDKKGINPSLRGDVINKLVGMVKSGKHPDDIGRFLSDNEHIYSSHAREVYSHIAEIMNYRGLAKKYGVEEADWKHIYHNQMDKIKKADFVMSPEDYQLYLELLSLKGVRQKHFDKFFKHMYPEQFSKYRDDYANKALLEDIIENINPKLKPEERVGIDHESLRKIKSENDSVGNLKDQSYLQKTEFDDVLPNFEGRPLNEVINTKSKAKMYEDVMSDYIASVTDGRNVTDTVMSKLIDTSQHYVVRVIHEMEKSLLKYFPNKAYADLSPDQRGILIEWSGNKVLKLKNIKVDAKHAKRFQEELAVRADETRINAIYDNVKEGTEITFNTKERPYRGHVVNIGQTGSGKTEYVIKTVEGSLVKVKLQDIQKVFSGNKLMDADTLIMKSKTTTDALKRKDDLIKELRKIDGSDVKNSIDDQVNTLQKEIDSYNSEIKTLENKLSANKSTIDIVVDNPQDARKVKNLESTIKDAKYDIQEAKMSNLTYKASKPGDPYYGYPMKSTGGFEKRLADSEAELAKLKSKPNPVVDEVNKKIDVLRSSVGQINKKIEQVKKTPVLNNEASELTKLFEARKIEQVTNIKKLEVKHRELENQLKKLRTSDNTKALSELESEIKRLEDIIGSDEALEAWARLHSKADLEMLKDPGRYSRSIKYSDDMPSNMFGKTNKDGIFIRSSEPNKKLFFDTLKKRAEKMYGEDYSWDQIKKIIDSPEKLKQFIKEHEMSHLINEDYLKANKKGDLSDALTREIESRADMDALGMIEKFKVDEAKLQWEKIKIDTLIGVDDEVIRYTKWIREEFIRMGEKEVGIGKLSEKAFDANMAHYVPHILTPDGKSHLEHIQGVMGNPGSAMGQDLGYGAKFNPFSKSRKVDMTIDEANTYFYDKLKGNNYFSDSLSDIYLIRAQKHNELMYDDEYMKTMMNVFGRELTLGELPSKGMKSVFNHGMLRKKVGEVASTRLQLQMSKAITQHLEQPQVMEIINETVDKVMRTQKLDKKLIRKQVFSDEVGKEIERFRDIHYPASVRKEAFDIYHSDFISKTGLEKELGDFQVPMVEISSKQHHNIGGDITELQENLLTNIRGRAVRTDIKSNDIQALKKNGHDVHQDELGNHYYYKYKGGLVSLVKQQHKDMYGTFPTDKQLASVIRMDGEQARKMIDRMKKNSDQVDITRLDRSIKKLDNYDNLGRVQISEVSESIVQKANQARKLQISRSQNQFLSMYDKFLYWTKLMQTTVMPAFHIRNKMSDTFLNWMGVGVDAINPQLQRSAWRASRHLGDAGKLKDLKPIVTPDGTVYHWDQLYNLAKQHKVINEGYFARELGAGTQSKGLFGGGKWDISDTTNFIGFEKGAQIGGRIENQDRLLHFASMLRQGHDVRASASSSTKYLFDYSDVTAFEQNVMKRLIPYYTWLRKNGRLQVGELMEQPGKFRDSAKAMNMINGMNNEEDRMNRMFLSEFAENWLQLPFEVGGNPVIANPFMPFQDMNRFPNPFDPSRTARDLFSQSAVAIKVPIELAMNKNVFFGNQIIDKENDSPATILSKSVNYMLKQTAPYNVGQGSVNKSGADQAMYIASQIIGIKHMAFNYNTQRANVMKEAEERYYDPNSKKWDMSLDNLSATFLQVMDGIGDSISHAVPERPKGAGSYTGALRPISQISYDELSSEQKEMYTPPSSQKAFSYHIKALELEQEALQKEGVVKRFVWGMFDLAGKGENYEVSRVTRVIDGDTVILNDENSIRILLVDTTEMNFDNQGNPQNPEPFAEEAREYTKKALLHEDVKVVFEGNRTDYYGRSIGYIEVNGEDFGLNLTKKGLSKTRFTHGVPENRSPYSRTESYFDAERKASEDKEGMWEIPGISVPGVDTDISKGAMKRWLETNNR